MCTPGGEGKSPGAPHLGLPTWPRPCGGAAGGSWGVRAPATLLSPSRTRPLPGGGGGGGRRWSLNTPPPALPPLSDRMLPGPQPSDPSLLWEEEPWLSADWAWQKSKSYGLTDRCFPGGREEATFTRQGPPGRAVTHPLSQAALRPTLGVLTALVRESPVTHQARSRPRGEPEAGWRGCPKQAQVRAGWRLGAASPGRAWGLQEGGRKPKPPKLGCPESKARGTHTRDLLHVALLQEGL